MKLQILYENGEVETIVDDIEQYDLSKPIARSMICDDIKRELDRTFSLPYEKKA